MKVKPGYDALMHEVCVGKGWCGGVVNGEPRHVDDLIPANGEVTADQFVDLLFRADGLNPDEQPERWRADKVELRDAFVRHMGGDVVDARRLRRDAD